MEKFSKWLSPIVVLFFVTALSVTASSTIGTSITTGGDLGVTGTATVGALTIGATPFNPANYVLLAGDADGQTIQGRTGADKPRLEIGVTSADMSELWGSGDSTTAGYVMVDNQSATIGVNDGDTWWSAHADVLEGGIGGFTVVSVDNATKAFKLYTWKTCPVSAIDACSAGEICFDANYIYRCVATDTWKRVSITTW
ncbi:MAG: hypothetical protein NUW02_03450 [Candidatus Campbellbacteria bacterium]|nr:hypothetical protein [Candidatus Campbellbacteria bacterium]